MSSSEASDNLEKRDLERLTSSEEEPPKFFGSETTGENAISNPLTRSSTQNSVQSRQEQDLVTRILTSGTTRSRGPIPTMGGGRDYPPSLPDRDPYRVDFDGPDDPRHPHNWPMKRKVVIGACLGFTTLTVAWGSAVFSSAVPFVSEEFHVGEVVAILTISLYVLGFASGPVIWAPLSELYGRKIPVILSMLGFTIFSFGVATAKDLQTIMLCRFFTGFIGAGPLAVVAAAFADMFDNETRGKAIVIFSLMVFAGPILAPVVGGFISYSYLGWRWTEYITGIMGALAVILDIFFYQESYHPIILVRKAQEIRKRTGNWGVYAPHEQVEFSASELVEKNLSRPLVMLFTEPILFLLTLYTAFIYGLLYLFL
jgi:DHA1 family multidrug resistance protein-like MFS transporter